MLKQPLQSDRSLTSRLQNLPWFNNATWDFIWFQCSFWMVPLFAYIYFAQGVEVFKLGIAIIFVLVRLAHGYVTTYMCVAHPGYKEISRKQPMRFFGIPAIITLGFVIYFFLPKSIFPYTTYERLEIYYFIAFPYIYVHYAGQHIGILSMYRAKAGQKLSSFHKKFEKIYCHLVVSLTLTALNLAFFYDHKIGGISWREIFMVEHINWTYVTWAIVFPMAGIFTYLELGVEKKSWPKILYGLSLPIMSLILSFEDFVFAFLLIHLQHYFSHFGLCGHMLSKYDERFGKSTQNKAMSMYLKYLSLIVLSVGLAIVHYHYRVVGSISGRYDVVFKDFIPLSNPESFSRVLVLGTFVGLGICHYYYDRLAFRFSDPEIKKVLQKYL